MAETADKPDVFQPPRMVRGRKQYNCCECGDKIFEGEEHELFSGKFKAEDAEKDEADHDGRVWKTFRTCHRCHLARWRVKELLPSHQHPKHGELASACRHVEMPLPKEFNAAVIIQRFCSMYRTDKE